LVQARELAIHGISPHRKTVYPLFAGALGISCATIVVAFFQSNYYLGGAQNAYDGNDTGGMPTGEHKLENQPPMSRLQKILSFWDK
jgi:hypothetical protein